MRGHPGRRHPLPHRHGRQRSLPTAPHRPGHGTIESGASRRVAVARQHLLVADQSQSPAAVGAVEEAPPNTSTGCRTSSVRSVYGCSRSLVGCWGWSRFRGGGAGGDHAERLSLGRDGAFPLRGDGFGHHRPLGGCAEFGLQVGDPLTMVVHRMSILVSMASVRTGRSAWGESRGQQSTQGDHPLARLVFVRTTSFQLVQAPPHRLDRHLADLGGVADGERLSLRHHGAKCPGHPHPNQGGHTDNGQWTGMDTPHPAATAGGEPGRACSYLPNPRPRSWVGVARRRGGAALVVRASTCSLESGTKPWEAARSGGAAREGS